MSKKSSSCKDLTYQPSQWIDQLAMPSFPPRAYKEPTSSRGAFKKAESKISELYQSGAYLDSQTESQTIALRLQAGYHREGEQRKSKKKQQLNANVKDEELESPEKGQVGCSPTQHNIDKNTATSSKRVIDLTEDFEEHPVNNSDRPTKVRLIKSEVALPVATTSTRVLAEMKNEGHQLPKSVTVAASRLQTRESGSLPQVQVRAECVQLRQVIIDLLVECNEKDKRIAQLENLVVSQTVKELLPLLSLYIILHGLGAWIDALLGALNRPAIFPALILSADYCAGIPLGFWLAFSQKWGLAGMWTGLVVSLAYACIVGSFILVRATFSSSYNVTEPLTLVDEEILSP